MDEQDIQNIATGIVDCHKKAGKIDRLKNRVGDEAFMVSYLMGQVDIYAMGKVITTKKLVTISDFEGTALLVLAKIKQILAS